MPPLSVLDLSVVTTGTPPAAALRNSIDLAQHVDRLGYVRYWLAEHHNLPSVASPAPDLMIGQIAAATPRIRVGSGRVMLPNHTPLVIAERFKMLEALFPGHPYNNVVAMPSDTPLPPIWLLGSSGYSAELSAQVGTGLHLSGSCSLRRRVNRRGRCR